MVWNIQRRCTTRERHAIRGTQHRVLAGRPQLDSVGPRHPIASVSPDPLRYSDGIPRVWEGDPVLRGQAAIDAANRSSDSASFLVAFWPGSKVLIPAWLWAGMTTRSTCVGAWVMWAISQGSFQALWECSCALTRGLSRPDL